MKFSVPGYGSPCPAASTNQLDFAVPGRMGLTYRGPDNTEHTPYVIHRAPLGTHERFVAFLIEFLLVGAASSSVFFLLMVMSLIDVVAGFTVSITSASRDVSMN